MKKYIDIIPSSLRALRSAASSAGGLVKIAALAACAAAATASYAQDAPSDLAVASSGETSIGLSWTPTIGGNGLPATHYRIRIEEPNGSRYTERTADEASSHTVTNLAANSDFQFEIKAYYDGVADSGYSDPITGSTGGGVVNTPPSAPGNLQAPSVTETSITLVWDASTDDGSIASYRVRTVGSSVVDVGNVTTHTITGLTAGTSYTFDVRATDDDGANSAYSDPVTASTASASGGDTVAPSVPQNLQQQGATESSITLTWDASTDASGIASYRIRRDGGSAVNVAGDATTHTVNGLASDTSYVFDIRATDTNGNNSAYSSSITASTDAVSVGGFDCIFTSPADLDVFDAVDFDAGGGPTVTVMAGGGAGASSVQFFINDFHVHTDYSSGPNYEYQYKFLQGGSYVLTAIATDANGIEKSDSVTITVNREDIAGQYNFKRLNGNRPIVDAQLFIDSGATRVLRRREREYDNINGPSVLNVNGVIANADILEIPDGSGDKANYYMYFAHHHGQYIRLAYAKNVEGPWFLYNVGPEVDRDKLGVLAYNNGGSTAVDDQTIQLDNNLLMNNHMASPEVMVENGEILLYFHALVEHNGNNRPPQKTFVARSAGNRGLDFNGRIESVIQCNYYATFWKYNGQYFGTQNQGRLLTHRDPDNLLAPVGSFDYSGDYWRKSSESPFEVSWGRGVRHVKAALDGDTVILTFSVTGDVPEQLYYRTVDMVANAPLNHNDWTAGPVFDLAHAEAGWEGGQFPVVASEASAVDGDVNQLRDPDIFIDNDGQKYVFYTGEGEEAIGVALLEWVD